MSEQTRFSLTMVLEVDQICRQGTMFVANASAQSITEMAMVTRRPEKFIGMH